MSITNFNISFSCEPFSLKKSNKVKNILMEKERIKQRPEVKVNNKQKSHKSK